MKIIVIGNGSSVLNAINGAFIDNFDIVVRLNKFKITNYEEFVGTKTNIICTKWADLELISHNNINEIWLPYPEPPNWWISSGSHEEISEKDVKKRIEKFNLSEKTILFLKNEFVEEVEKFYNYTCQPSTGIVSLMLAIQKYKNQDIYYIGFDSLSNGWYWNTNHDCLRSKYHSSILEYTFLNYLKDKYKIKKYENSILL